MNKDEIIKLFFENCTIEQDNTGMPIFELTDEQLQAFADTLVKNDVKQPVSYSAWENLNDTERLPYIENAAEVVSDSYLCTRVWEAWHVGTMTEDDFVEASEDDEYVESVAQEIYEKMILPSIVH